MYIYHSPYLHSYRAQIPLPLYGILTTSSKDRYILQETVPVLLCMQIILWYQDLGVLILSHDMILQFAKGILVSQLLIKHSKVGSSFFLLAIFSHWSCLCIKCKIVFSLIDFQGPVLIEGHVLHKTDTCMCRVTSSGNVLSWTQSKIQYNPVVSIYISHNCKCL